MAPILQWISIATGLAGAIFWFASATGKVTPILMYGKGPPPEHDPFYDALIHSARMNRIAALFTGLSGLAAAVSMLIEKYRAPGF